MAAQAPLYGAFGTLAAAVLAAAVAIYLNTRDQRAGRRQEELTRRREIYSEAFSAVTASQQALVGILRPYRNPPGRFHRAGAWQVGLDAHWDRFEAAQQRQIEAYAMVRLLGKKTVNDAMARVVGDLVAMQLILRAKSGAISPVKTIGSSLSEALRVQDHLEDITIPKLMAAMRRDLGVAENQGEVTVADEIAELKLDDSAVSK